MYDERETRDIIERALELDEQRRAVMTREQIIEVAAELGVSRYAIDAALAERAGTQAVATSREPRSHGLPALDALRAGALQPSAERGGLTTMRILNISVFAGIATGLLMGGTFGSPQFGMRPGVFVVGIGPLMTLLAAGGLVMASGGMALSERTRSGLHYVARNAALWLGFGAGGMLAGSLLAKFGPLGMFPTHTFEAALAFSLAGGAITTVVGATFMAVREALRTSPLRRVSFGDGGTASDGSDGGDGPGAGPENGTRSPAFARARLRVLKRLRDWLGTSARSLVTGLRAQHSA